MNSPEKKVEAILVLEILGRPAEYLTETLNRICEDIKKEQGTKVKNVKINTPELIKDKKDFYSSFCEVEVETDGIINLVILMFKYMPAHVEVISPANIPLANFEWSEVLSEITRRLHDYEEVTRIVQAEKSILETKLRDILDGKVKLIPRKDVEAQKVVPNIEVKEDPINASEEKKEANEKKSKKKK